MILTAQQVRDRLMIGDTGLKNLVRDGKLHPCNQIKPGAKKYFMRFENAEVNRYVKENNIKPPVSIKPNSISNPVEPANGILTHLGRIEAKLDRLIRLWS